MGFRIISVYFSERILRNKPGNKQGHATNNCCDSLKSSWLKPNIQRNEELS